MAVTIRKAEPEDIDAVYGLICELEQRAGNPSDFSAFTAVYHKNIVDRSILYLVAMDGGSPVGFGSLHIQLLLHHVAPVAEVQELVVKAGYRGSGVGHALIDALEGEAKARGCVLLEVCCNQKREASNAFYGRVGFLKSHYKHTKALQ